jgi:hypothetical protein
MKILLDHRIIHQNKKPLNLNKAGEATAFLDGRIEF